MDKADDWRTLAKLMSDISEDAYCAGWMDKIEFQIWGAMHDGDRRIGQTALDDGTVDRLRELSRDIGGWVHFNDTVGEEEFVGSEQWAATYAGWAKR